MRYIRISEGLKKYTLVPETDNPWAFIKDNSKDHYIGIYRYNEDHFKTFQTTGSVAGIKDTTTNTLLFDFDDATNIENARNDATTLVSRLLTGGVPQEAIQISFSGNKGFAVQVDTDYTMSPEDFKRITFGLAGDLTTFDKVVNDAQRLIRMVGTKNQKSGLYKIPLSVNALAELPISEIKSQAASLDNFNDDLFHSWISTTMPESFKTLNFVEKKETKVISHDLNMSLKPKWLSEAKYALQEGFFGAGERNEAFMILASTYKNQGFNKEIVYRMLKGVAEVQAERNGVERYSDKELYNNVLNVVFNPNWKGGTYSFENTPLLQEVTARMGLSVPKVVEEALVSSESISSVFRKFATEIDKNTIKLGIDTIDKNVTITTSMLVGVVAPPSAGKTSISLSVLNTLSNAGLDADFYSLDMGAPLVYQRLIQKHTGISGKKIFEMYKNGDKRVEEFERLVSENYKNVRFCFRSGLTVEDIRSHLKERLEKEGKVSKLIVVDYLECIQGPFSDATANSSMIAQQLKDIANDFSCCVLLLLQPSKMGSGDPSGEILSYRAIKGSSAIEQACSVVFSLWRPGFSPKDPDNDRFMSIAVLKNRMGSLGLFDFAWEGVTGKIRDLEDEERADLEELRKRKAEEAKDKI